MKQFFRHFLLVNFLLVLGLASAQDVKMQQWRAQAKNTGALLDSQFSACYNLGRYYMYSQPDSLVFFSKKANEIAVKHNLINLKGKALGLLGLAYYMKEDYIEASIAIKKAIQDKVLAQDSMAMSQQFNNLGLVYNELQLFTDAISAFQNSLHFLSEGNDFAEVSTNYNIAVTLLYSLENHKDALKYFRHCLVLQPDNEANRNILGQAYNGIGVVFMDHQNLQDSAMYYFEIALQTFAQSQIYQRNLVVFNQGISTYKAKKFEKSLAYFNGLRDYYLSSELYPSLQTWHQTKANLFLDWQKFDLMKSQLDSALWVTQTYKLASIPEVYNLLAQYFAHEGMYKEALAQTHRAQNLEDSIAEASNASQINTLRATIEEDRLDKENANLQSERDLIAAKSYRQSLLQYLLLLLAAVFLGLILMFYLRFRDKSRLSKKLELVNIDLAEKSEELQKLNRKKDQLFGILSHDLRTPLLAFEGITQAAAQQATAANDSKFKESTTQMHAHASALRQTLNNILAWSKTEQGLSAPKFRAVLLQQVLQNALKLYSLSIAQQNIKLVLEVDPDAMIFADKGAIETVIRNVINNAVKHTQNGGLHIWTETNATFTTVHIVDTGTGISADVLEEIKAGNNPGLGLHLCEALMTQNKGSMQLKSEAGKGTEVLLQFVPYIV